MPLWKWMPFSWANSRSEPKENISAIGSIGAISFGRRIGPRVSDQNSEKWPVDPSNPLRRPSNPDIASAGASLAPRPEGSFGTSLYKMQHPHR